MGNEIALALGIGIGVFGLAAYVKMNLEARRDAKDYETRIRELEQMIVKGLTIDPTLLIREEKELIDNAKYEIWMLGINGLGVFHESFENMISFIKRGGKVRVLLLDPESEAFKQREEREEGIGKKKSGRLKAEYLTSVAFCKDIVRLSNNTDLLELRVYSEEPNEALLVADPEEESGKIHINEYSPEFIRGYIGEHRSITKKLQSMVFPQLLEKYNTFWDNSRKIAIYEHDSENAA